jgi:hypothetical protein
VGGAGRVVVFAKDNAKPSRASRFSRRVLLLAAALMWVTACGTRSSTLPVAPAVLVPLSAYLPPSPEPVLVARPVELFREPATHTLFRALVDAAHEQSFSQRTAVDPRTLEELVVREEQTGYLLLARGPFDAASVVQSAGARLAVPDVSTDAPLVRREGLAGRGRWAYAALGAHTVLVAKNVTPQVVGEVIARFQARGQFPVPSALAEEPARALAARYASAPLVVYAPKPLALQPGTGLALLLAEQRALAAVAEPRGTRIALSVDLRGEFPEGADQNFRTLGRSMASTELMRLLGLDTVLQALEVKQDTGVVQIAGQVEAKGVAQGIRALFFADTRALFE